VPAAGYVQGMASFGYFLFCEEFGPREPVHQARLAERAGFERLWISDHFHPWNDAQGHSLFVWSVIGALSEATSLPITTAVTYPTVRVHTAVVAQAAATAAVRCEGRFVLGVGSGEALNEHILGDRWPPAGGAFGHAQGSDRTDPRAAHWPRGHPSRPVLHHGETVTRAARAAVWRGVGVTDNSPDEAPGVDRNSAEDLDEDRLRVDPLETGMDPPERWAGGTRHGMTPAEQAETRPLDQRLAEEQPDVQPANLEDDAELDERVRREAAGRGQVADEAGGSVASYYRTPHPPD